MIACEICEARATHTCAGLDVPMLHFCDKHAEEHAQLCPEVKRGRAKVDRHESASAS